MKHESRDHNLLAGVLAVQLGFVNRDVILEALHECGENTTLMLTELLRTRKLLDRRAHRSLCDFLERYLDHYDGNPSLCLAALSGIAALRDEFHSLQLIPDDATLVFDNSSRVSENVRPDRDSDDAEPRFHILHAHARGGIGEVFLARDKELNREVALKEILSKHAFHEDHRSRFILEAEITGRLEHPGIVPVYALGRYPDGRPYYAMRFIRGKSLRDAVDELRAAHATSQSGRREHSTEHNVAFRKLLGRFIDVCNAIEYAHSRGVVHRDLKPQNIMLGAYGETLVVDWGLAKIIGDTESPGVIDSMAGPVERLKASTTHSADSTQMGDAVGTPAFMPPEQAAGRLDKLGPAADIYALGATLYYLLTGRAPFTKDNVSRTLQKVQLGEFPPPGEIDADVPGPLEAVCLRAMALVPGDRYASAAELGDELENWLADEPVAAFREPLVLRARRWFRKHPKTVAVGTTVILSGLAAMIAVATVVADKNTSLSEKNEQLYRKNREIARANAELEDSILAEREAKRIAVEQRLAADQARTIADEARTAADQARRQAETVSDYLVNAFRSPDPKRDGRSITIAEVLDRAQGELTEQFVNDPITHASLLNAIGHSYQGLGLFLESIPIFEKAARLRSEALGPTDIETLRIRNNVAVAYRRSGQPKVAIERLEETLRDMEAVLDKDHPFRLTTLNNLAEAYHTAGEYEEAIWRFEEAIWRRKSFLGERNEYTLSSMNGLALSTLMANRPDEAALLLERTLKLRREELGENHPDTLTSMNYLALAYEKTNRTDDAMSLYETTLAGRIDALGEDHPDTLISVNNLAQAFQKRGRIKEAVGLLEETRAELVDRLTEQHPDTLTVMNNLALAYRADNRTEDAGRLFTKTLALRQDVLPADHPDTLASMHNLALFYQDTGRLDDAIPLQQETVRLMTAKQGPYHPDTQSAMFNLGLSFQKAGRFQDAIDVLEKTLSLQHSSDDDSLKARIRILDRLAAALQSAGQIPDAIQRYSELLPLMEADYGENAPETLYLLGNLASMTLTSGKADQALPLLERFVRGRREQLADNRPAFADILFNIGREIARHGETGEALPYLREGIQIDQSQSSVDWMTFDAMALEGSIIAGQGDDKRNDDMAAAEENYGEAETLLLEAWQGMQEHAEEIPDASAARPREILRRIIDLYTAWGKPDEAMKWGAILNPEDTEAP